MTRGFGIVGTGVIAAVHAEAIAPLPGAALVAVTDVAPGAAAAFAAARGCAAEPDLDALLARPDVDVVSVCVPSGLHAEVDLLRWCMGPVTEVTALCATQTHQIEVEDTSLAALRFSSGAVGTIVASTCVFPGFAQRLEITGTEGTITIEDGAIIRRAFGGGAHEPGGPPGGGAAAGSNPAAVDVASHAAQLTDLLAAIEAGREPAVTGENGRAALEIVCAVYESARTRRAVTLAP